MLGNASKWKEDSSANKCRRCRKEFTFFRGKHHCRLCGHLFCDNCSKHIVSARCYLGSSHDLELKRDSKGKIMPNEWDSARTCLECFETLGAPSSSMDAIAANTCNILLKNDVLVLGQNHDDDILYTTNRGYVLLVYLINYIRRRHPKLLEDITVFHEGFHSYDSYKIESSGGTTSCERKDLWQIKKDFRNALKKNDMSGYNAPVSALRDYLGTDYKDQIHTSFRNALKRNDIIDEKDYNAPVSALQYYLGDRITDSDQYVKYSPYMENAVTYCGKFNIPGIWLENPLTFSRFHEKDKNHIPPPPKGSKYSRGVVLWNNKHPIRKAQMKSTLFTSNNIKDLQLLLKKGQYREHEERFEYILRSRANAMMAEKVKDYWIPRMKIIIVIGSNHIVGTVNPEHKNELLQCHLKKKLKTAAIVCEEGRGFKDCFRKMTAGVIKEYETYHSKKVDISTNNRHNLPQYYCNISSSSAAPFARPDFSQELRTSEKSKKFKFSERFKKFVL